MFMGTNDGPLLLTLDMSPSASSLFAGSENMQVHFIPLIAFALTCDFQYFGAMKIGIAIYSGVDQSKSICMN